MLLKSISFGNAAGLLFRCMLTELGDVAGLTRPELVARRMLAKPGNVIVGGRTIALVARRMLAEPGNVIVARRVLTLLFISFIDFSDDVRAVPATFPAPSRLNAHTPL